ncbi:MULTISPECIES: RadC family protein [unclassified Lactobacillus]|uniref:JAB domain-containing protein n=1 Tax=unclassified Lactobacillus TaxID=2620435 RepID=UPI000EFD2C81|nr:MULTISPECIES: JAB domain-containing protein [unclassified Lactobacillus]RMC46290.1 DNA repair protein RadC [Lactobacillus sp. ESL0230]RMC50594.1 DNA repair protein RadC [Lactobacillus sp. ESL0225]
MEIIKSKHYLINTDFEIMNSLFDQLTEQGITRFEELSSKLKQLHINNFNELLKFISNDECDQNISIICENLLERLRFAVPDREAVLTSSNEVGMYLTDKLAGHKQEQLWAIYIDNSNHIVAEKCLFIGTLDKSVAHPREIFRWAVIYACAGFIVVHNHPSGNLLPSRSDIELTKSLHSCAEMMHIDFLDHFIVGKGQYFSMQEHQLF